MKTKTLRKTRQDISLFKSFLSQKGNVVQEPGEFSPEELNTHFKKFIVGVICLYFCVTLSDSIYNKQIMTWQDPNIVFIHLFWYIIPLTRSRTPSFALWYQNSWIKTKSRSCYVIIYMYFWFQVKIIFSTVYNLKLFLAIMHYTPRRNIKKQTEKHTSNYFQNMLKLRQPHGPKRNK